MWIILLKVSIMDILGKKQIRLHLPWWAGTSGFFVIGITGKSWRAGTRPSTRLSWLLLRSRMPWQVHGVRWGCPCGVVPYWRICWLAGSWSLPMLWWSLVIGPSAEKLSWQWCFGDFSASRKFWGVTACLALLLSLSSSCLFPSGWQSGYLR